MNSWRYQVDILQVVFLAHQELASEAEIFLSMDHPHVVRLFDVYEDSEKSGHMR